MADINAIAYSPLDLGKASNQEPIKMKAWNTEISNLDSFIDFSDCTLTNIIGATSSLTKERQPLVPSKDTTYDTDLQGNRPISASSARPVKTVVTAPAGGVEIDMSNIILITDQEGVIGIPLLVSSTTPTLTIVLESTTSADTLTFTAINTANYGFEANKWRNLALKLTQGTAAGTIDYSTFKKVKITASAAMTFYTQQIQVGNNLTSLVGAEIAGSFHCISDLAKEVDKAYADVMCGSSLVDAKTPGIASMTITVTTKDWNFSLDAFSSGKTLRNDDTNKIYKRLNGVGGFQNKAIVNDALDINSVLDPNNLFVEIDNKVFTRVFNESQLGNSNFFYDSTTTPKKIKFAPGVWNGFYPDVSEKRTKNLDYYIMDNNAESLQFEIEIPRKTENGKTLYMIIKRVKIVGVPFSQEDVNVTSEVELKPLPVLRGGRLQYLISGLG